jgi:arylsulfatase A-like enzyme/cytochrome c-type biogenesis protein CcmH/NrfG
MVVIRQLVCVVWMTASALAGTVAPPNVILITLDTVRADRMGFLGAKLGLTANLDTLARESVVFTRAYSQVPLTAPSHATILTGTYPQFHQVRDFQVPLAQDLPYAPELLRAKGYGTAAFIGAMVLDPGVGLARGFDRGFDTYDAGFHEPYPGEDRYTSAERRGGEVVAHALSWLKVHPRGPFFMWLHLYDAHDPYEPPEPYKSKYAAAPYDGEIAYVDSEVGKFLTQLRAQGLYDGAVIAVMADHGESLGDHGEDFHGFFLYDETVHVPLVIKLPGETSTGKASTREIPAGKRIESRVGLVDVLPTILQVVGIAVPPEVQGESLLGMMNQKPASTPAEGIGASAIPETSQDRPAYAETEYGHRAYGWSSLRALRTGRYLYIEAPRRELYDQSADPKAEHNLSLTSAAVTGTLAGQLDAFLQKTSSARELPKLVVDPEAQAKVAALGYVATDSSVSKAGAKRGADIDIDIKDKIEIGNLIHRANFLAEEARFQEAVPLLRQLIAKEPAMALLYTKLGQCLMQMKDYPPAVPVLRKLVELNPDSADAHFQLGEALLATQEYAAAVPELENVVAKMPLLGKAHLLLATAYSRTGRTPDAIKECNRVLEISPDDYRGNLLLGRILMFSGDPEAALPKLKKAAALQPKAPEPHMALSNAYLRLGRNEDVAREQSEAKRLGEGRPE